MKIVCQSVEAFLENVKSLGSVYGKRIFVQRSSVALNGKTKQDATSFDISIQCGAVMDLAEKNGDSDGSQALLLCGEYCGIDRTSSPQSTEGNAMFMRLKSQLQDYCRSNECDLLPGTLEL